MVKGACNHTGPTAESPHADLYFDVTREEIEQRQLQMNKLKSRMPSELVGVPLKDTR